MKTQTDKELLELAALAAGYEIQSYSSEPKACLWLYHPNDTVLDVWGERPIFKWNPLTDDGDAFRLAVRIRLSVDHNHTADQQRWVASDRNGCEGCYAPVSCVEDEFEERDRDAATRRAIVRAAAAIGQSMKEQGK